MTFRSSRKSTASKATVTDQVSDRTDDLVAALDAAREALARASAAAGRKGAELGAGLGKQASDAADKLMPERARPRARAGPPPPQPQAPGRGGRPHPAGGGLQPAGRPQGRPGGAGPPGRARRRLGGRGDLGRRPPPPGRGDPAPQQRGRRRPGRAAPHHLAQPVWARYRPGPRLTTRPSLARAARVFTTTPRTSGVVNGSIRRWVRARSRITVQWRVSPPASPSTLRQASLGSMIGPAYRWSSPWPDEPQR